jgi:hypothetical protein
MGGLRKFGAVIVCAVAAACSGNSPAPTLTPRENSSTPTPAATAAASSPSLTGSPPAGAESAGQVLPPPVLPAGPNDAKPLNVAVTTETARAVSAIVPIAGGMLETTGADGTRYQLTVPPTALLVDTQITMTPLASITDSASGADRAWPAPLGVDLQPDGLRLYDWATLDVIPADGNGGVNAMAFGYEGDGHDLHPRPVQTDPTKIELKLLHFSGEAVYAGDDISIPVDPTQSQPVDWEAQIEQAVAQLNSDERARELSGQQPDPDYSTRFQQLLDVYWDKIVEPLLGPIATSCEFARANLHTPLGWGRQAELNGLGSDPRVGQIMDTLTQAIQNCWDEIKSHCLDPSSAEQRQIALQIARQAQLLGMDPSRFDVNFLFDSASKDLCGDLFGTVVWTHDLDQHPSPSWNAHDVTNESVTINVNMNGAGGDWTDRGSSYSWTGAEHESEKQGPCGNTQDTSWIGGGAFGGDNGDISVGWDPDTQTVGVSLDVVGQMRGREIYEGVPETVIGFGCTVPPYSREIAQGGPGQDDWAQEPTCEDDNGDNAGKASADGTSIAFNCVQTDSGPLNDGSFTETWTFTGTLTDRKPPS